MTSDRDDCDNGCTLVVECLLKEYECLKEEQVARIGYRDNLLYVTLGSLGALVGYSFFEGESADIGRRAVALFAGPWVSIVLGWSYIVNDHMVTRIGRYLQRELEPELRRVVKGSVGLLAWEQVHRIGEERFARKVVQLAIDLIAFPFSGGVLLCIALQHSWRIVGAGAIFVGAVEGVLLAVITCFMVKSFRESVRRS